VDATSGCFSLFVPPEINELEISFIRDDKRLACFLFNSKKSMSMDFIRSENRIKEYSLDPILIDFKDRQTPAVEMTLTGDAKWLFLEAEKMLLDGKTSDLDSAIVCYNEAKRLTSDPNNTKTIDDRILKAYDRLFHYCLSQELYQKGSNLAKAANQNFPNNRSFIDWRKKFERECIPKNVRQSLEQAGKAHDNGDYIRVEAMLTKIMETERLTSYYRERVAKNLEEVKKDLYRAYFSKTNELMIKGRFEEAAPLYMECRRLKPLDPVLAIWETKLSEYVDEIPPEINLISPITTCLNVDKSNFVIKGVVKDNLSVERLTINGQSVSLEGENPREKPFSYTAQLKEGDNWFIILAYDKKKLKKIVAIVVTYSLAPIVPGFYFIRNETFDSAERRETVKVYGHKKTGLEFVLVPGGVFQMGSPLNEKDRDPNEGDFEAFKKEKIEQMRGA